MGKPLKKDLQREFFEPKIRKSRHSISINPFVFRRTWVMINPDDEFDDFDQQPLASNAETIEPANAKPHQSPPTPGAR